jgi:chromate transporter
MATLGAWCGVTLCCRVVEFKSAGRLRGEEGIQYITCSSSRQRRARTMTTAPPPSEPAAPDEMRPTLRALAVVFLRLGITAFGGPAAHIALMEQEIVQRRRWLTRGEFLDLIAAANLIPGPNSTEVAIHVGFRAGWRGLIVAGVCFILPAALIVGVLGWVYEQYGSLPAAEGLLFGVKPVVIAVILQALWKFAHASIRSWPLAVVAAAAGLLTVLGTDELIVLVMAGFAVALGRRWWRRAPPDESQRAATVLGLLIATIPSAPAAAATVGLWPLFLVFLKIGSVLFGSGYVLLAFLRTEFVERRGWLTEAQLIDAVAVGQVTPGPVFTTATFIGYLVGGAAGAVVATVGIFLPAFVFVALSGPLIPRLRASPTAAAFLDGVVVASLALMVVVTWQLMSAALEGFDLTQPRFWLALGLLGVSAIGLRSRVNSAWLVVGGGLIGLLCS